MIEHIRIIVAFFVLFISSYILKLFFIDIPRAKVNSCVLVKEFTQDEINKNNMLRKRHYDNLQKKFDKLKTKQDRYITKKQDSFDEFRNLLS